jgi:hypothetical protein
MTKKRLTKKNKKNSACKKNKKIFLNIKKTEKFSKISQKRFYKP